MSTARMKMVLRDWPYALAVLAFAAGFAASGWFNRGPSTQLRIESQIEGTVSLVNYDNSGICIVSDSDKKQYCSEPLQVPGAAPLKVGDHVVVAVALMGIGGGSAIEVYIVTSPAPPHG